MLIQPTSGVMNKLLGSFIIRQNYNIPFPNLPNSIPEGVQLVPPLLQPIASNGSIVNDLGRLYSSADKTMEARGIQQQTFLGASIRSFNMNGGFGDSSSNLTVELVNDEFNMSDLTPYGTGIDEYHGGQRDFILPPIPGTPVFFKFGENVATTEQAYRRIFDKINGINTGGNSFAQINAYDYIDDSANPYYTRYIYGPNGSPLPTGNNLFTGLKTGVTYNLNNLRQLNSNDVGRGYNHITFGGLLQSFLQNKGQSGNPTFTVQVIDPREILSNVVVILNNYAESTYGEKNIFNVYGFLEFNLLKESAGKIKAKFGGVENYITRKTNKATGEISYVGSAFEKLTATIGEGKDEEERDDEERDEKGKEVNIPLDCYTNGQPDKYGYIKHFPITGTGMSRRSDQGIPWYRVKHAMNALLGWYGPLDTEYTKASFGGVINYKGYNYVVDFSGLPELPDLYFIDFEQINLLDLCLEICDVTNRELFVSLLPVINHPYCANLYAQNMAYASIKEKFISGIIRIDTIDKSYAPEYGSIKKYIDSLATYGIEVENQDVGYELSNNVTNKFVAGAQEVQHYFFTGNHDRDVASARNKKSQAESKYQWLLEDQLKQQILPYYGLLGNRAVTIPKGWGAYQQILLDTTGLDANGVGAYYVATEMELRYASISYKAWVDFLLQYNDKYFEKVTDDLLEGAAISSTPSLTPFTIQLESKYAVGVPRSTFDTFALQPFGPDSLPKSPCNPPYGYPLYYKRATKIGIPQAGFVQLGTRITGIINALTTLQTSPQNGVKDALVKLDQLEKSGTLSAEERAYIQKLKTAVKSGNINILNDISKGLHKIQASLPKLAKKGIANSMKVHAFLKKIADENLGKKFLVKMPQIVNKEYSNTIQNSNGYYTKGPFGFKPISTSGILGNNNQPSFWSDVRSSFPIYQGSFIKSFLTAWQSGMPPLPSFCTGALKSSFNPIAYKYEFNYTPTNLGGFFDFDLYANVYKPDEVSGSGMFSLNKNVIPKGITQFLIPQDLTNFISPEGRISPYVRFDHSEFLSLESLSSEDFTQQIIKPKDKGTAMVPDLVSALDNTQDDQLSFDSMDATKNDDEKKPESCAFVKCSVDENFYMTPQFVTRKMKLYGDYTVVNNITKPVPIFIQCSGWAGGIPGTSLVAGTGCYVNSYTLNDPHFIPTPEPLEEDDEGGEENENSGRLDFNRYYSKELKSYLIDTSLESLNQNHIYALITLPGKIIPTKSTRYRESANFDKQHWDIHHYLTMDVVKGLPEFKNPPYFKTAGKQKFDDRLKNKIGVEKLSKAWLAARAAKKALKFGGATVLNYTVPSPVYPDLVAIPLMSNERCYGPWISTYVDVQGFGFKDIGGKVEFTKDENLSPWQYGGYDLMNKAGELQASFANNLLLFSERGGFSIPAAPSVSLCEALIDGGPLVTNISVDVSPQGIKTTYKMDMYTPSFGKLQKQKQDSISKVSRERQRLRDERNLIVRKGLIKDQSRYGIGNLNAIANLSSEAISNLGQNTYLVASNSIAQQQGVAAIPPALSSSTGNFGADEEPTSYSYNTITYNVNDASMTNIDEITDQANQIDSYIDRASAMADAGGSYLSEIWTSYSEAAYHQSLPNKSLFEPDALKSKFESDDATTQFE